MNAPVQTQHPLTIEDLDVSLTWGDSTIHIIKNVSLDVAPHEVVGLVGESGSGKSVLCLAAMRLLSEKWHIDGEVVINGNHLVHMADRDLDRIRGSESAMIFQDAATALNPIATIGTQLTEAVQRLRGISKSDAQDICIELLEHVGIPEPVRRLKEYPFQLSGGQNQRVLIALALAGHPRILFADEPTTALDVTVQAQILDLILRVKDETGMGVVFVSHDLGVVSNICDRIAVMYNGRIVESGPTQAILNEAVHPYTRGLIKSMPTKRGGRLYSIGGSVPSVSDLFNGCAFAPRCPRKIDLCTMKVPPLECEESGKTNVACFNPEQDAEQILTYKERSQNEVSSVGPPLLQVKSASCDYEVGVAGAIFSKPKLFRAVSTADIEVGSGSSFALIGESGSGKSTIAKLCLGIEPPSEGEVIFDGKPVPLIGSALHKEFTLQTQVIPQSPHISTDPRIRIRNQIAEPLEIHGIGPKDQREKKARELIDMVGLPQDLGDRFPHEVSGGQLQRVVIARALAVNPRLLICDEPTSALDVSVQGQIIELLKDLRRSHGLTILFITHDLRIIRSLCDRVAVMYAGKIVEQADTGTLIDRPIHPYTQDLLAAAPDLEEKFVRPSAVLQSEVPQSGCRYSNRCKEAQDICRSKTPPVVNLRSGSTLVRCHFAEEKK